MRALLVLLAVQSACGSLSPQDKSEISGTAAVIAQCQALGRACKADGGSGDECYGRYESCMKDGGL